MTRTVRLIASLLAACSPGPGLQGGEAAAPEGQGRRAVHIALEGRLDDLRAEWFHERLREALRAPAPELLIVELHTQPREAGPALAVAAALARLHEMGVQTAALVRGPGSASDTLVALACDRLLAAPDARLMPLVPDAFAPPASEAERAKLAEALEQFSARRARLRAFYRAMLDPALEVFQVVFEGREDQPVFYTGDAYRKLEPGSYIRSERAAAPGAPPRLGAADLERLGLSSGTVQNAEQAAARLGLSATDLVSLGPSLPPEAATRPAPKGETPHPKARARPADGRRVVVIPLDGMVGDGMLYSVRRRLATARGLSPALVVFEVNTRGGALEAAFRIGDLIHAITDFPTVAWVNREAMSAGSMISVACSEIVMQENSLLGDSAVVDGATGQMVGSEKIDSYLRERFKNFGKGKYPGALIEAMITVDTEVYELETTDGRREYLTANEYQNLLRSPQDLARYTNARSAPRVVEKGRLLTMNEERAQHYGFSSATIKSREELLDFYGLAGREVVTLKWTWSEQLVRWLDLAGPLLLTLGLLAIMLEFKMGGSGIFAVAGLALIAIFFLGKYAAGLAEIWEIVLFFLGLAMLAIEVFVTPGFGLLGISGLILMFVSVVLSLQGFVLPGTPGEVGDFRWSIGQVGLVALALLVAVMVMTRYLHRAPYLGKMILAAPPPSTARTAVTEGVSLPPSPEAEEERARGLIGRRGKAITPLRPAGRVELDGEPLDVVTAGDFVAEGESIEVAEVRGNRIVVRRPH